MYIAVGVLALDMISEFDRIQKIDPKERKFRRQES